jgi:simple sugar transport system ATP-binding protein
VIVTHKLNEIMEIADRVTVMRDGQPVATRTIQETSQQELTQLMMGREVSLRADKEVQKPGSSVLEIKELRVQDETGRESFCGVSLELRTGEILGIAGVEGYGNRKMLSPSISRRTAPGCVGGALIVCSCPTFCTILRSRLHLQSWFAPLVWFAPAANS